MRLTCYHNICVYTYGLAITWLTLGHRCVAYVTNTEWKIQLFASLSYLYNLWTHHDDWWTIIGKTTVFWVVFISVIHRIIGWALGEWLFTLLGTPKGAFNVGDTVFVAERNEPGEKVKPGGVATVTAVPMPPPRYPGPAAAKATLTLGSDTEETRPCSRPAVPQL